MFVHELPERLLELAMATLQIPFGSVAVERRRGFRCSRHAVFGLLDSQTQRRVGSRGVAARLSARLYRVYKCAGSDAGMDTDTSHTRPANRRTTIRSMSWLNRLGAHF